MSHRVLFVCTGNICRSPTADGVLRYRLRASGLQERCDVDSAGTTAFHAGEPPDRRTVVEAARRGVDLTPLRARQVVMADFHQFTHILAMDRSHLVALQRMAPSDATAVVELFLPYAGVEAVEEVPDPYYSGPEAFTHVLDLAEAGVDGLMQRLGLIPRV